MLDEGILAEADVDVVPVDCILVMEALDLRSMRWKPSLIYALRLDGLIGSLVDKA